MPLVNIVGELGVGKTLSLTYLGWRNWFFKGMKIYSNIHLFKIPYVFIDGLNKLEDMSEGYVLIDEWWTLWDCVTPDTNIITHNDVMKPSECIDNNPLVSINFDNFSMENTKVGCVFKRDVRKNEKLMEIKTNINSIKASKNHRFFVIDNDKIIEKYAKDIKKGDYVLTVNKLEEGKESYLNKDFAQFLGYVFGDGTIYYRPKNVHWSKRKGLIKCDDKDKQILKSYGELMKKRFGLKFNINKNRDKNSFRMTIVNRKFIEKIIFNFLKDDKNVYIDKWGLRFHDIPEKIIKSNNTILASFLRGLFDAEGNIIKKEEKAYMKSDNKSINTRITISMVKHIDMERLKYLLLRFRIRSSFKICKNGKFYIYRLIIKDRKSILNFHRFIGFESQKKQEILEKCVEFINGRKHKFNSAYSYPFQEILKKIVDNICEEHNTSLSKIEHNLYQKYRIGFLRKWFEYKIGEDVILRFIKAIRKEYGDCEEIDFIEKIVKSNLIFEKVLIVRDIKPKFNYLVDLNIPKYENYIANGFVVHNSRLSRTQKNIAGANILARSRKKHLTYVGTSQVADSVEGRIRKVLDFTMYPMMNRDESVVKLLVFRGGNVKTQHFMKSMYFRTELIKSCYDSITGDQDIFYFNDDSLHIEKVEDFDENNHKEIYVPSMNPNTHKMELKRVKRFIKHFVNKDGFEIETSYGRKIKVTGDHSLFSYAKDEKLKSIHHSFRTGRGIIAPKPVRELKVGDYIVVPKNIPIIEKDVEKIDIAETILDKMEKLKKKMDIILNVKIDKKFLDENYDKIKAESLKLYGKNGYRRFFLFKKNLAVPYKILKGIGFFPKGQYYVTRKFRKCAIPNFIDVDKDLLWLLGLFVAEGSGCKQNYYLRFFSEHEFIMKAKRIIKKIFGVDMKIYRNREERIWDLQISNRCLSVLFQELTKDLSWIVQLPKHKLKYFLKGWWDGDGYHNGNAESFIICTSNEKLINPLIMMLHRFGVMPNISRTLLKEKFNYFTVRVSGISKEKANDILSWDNGIKQNIKAITTNDIALVKINNISPFKINDFVYDLSVEDNESFLAGNSVCAKNTDEIVNTQDESNEPPIIAFQQHYNKEHGYFCECKECGTKFFETFDKAEEYANVWYKKNFTTLKGRI